MKNSEARAQQGFTINGTKRQRGPNRVRTGDLLICSQMLYHWAMDPSWSIHNKNKINLEFHLLLEDLVSPVKACSASLPGTGRDKGAPRLSFSKLFMIPRRCRCRGAPASSSSCLPRPLRPSRKFLLLLELRRRLSLLFFRRLLLCLLRHFRSSSDVGWRTLDYFSWDRMKSESICIYRRDTSVRLSDIAYESMTWSHLIRLGDLSWMA